MNKVRSYTVYKSIIGDLYIVEENNKLVCIYIGKERFEQEETLDKVRFTENNPVLMMATKQLHEYFNHQRKTFELPLSIIGTPFQMSVWNALLQIPYGETKSYYEIAVSINNPQAVRAVGQANKANRFPIIIPCHRVIGKNNSLTGYAGKQTQLKEKLLSLEGVF